MYQLVTSKNKVGMVALIDVWKNYSVLNGFPLLFTDEKYWCINPALTGKVCINSDCKFSHQESVDKHRDEVLALFDANCEKDMYASFKTFKCQFQPAEVSAAGKRKQG